MILELEIGIVGGEEDGLDARGVADERLYSTPADAIAVVEQLGSGERGRYLLAATFGNVHGVYAEVNARLRPGVLRELRDAAVERFGAGAAFDFVFHGGSGSTPQQIAEALSYGVVKLNLDTDLQYAYTRAVADHVFRNYDGVLQVKEASATSRPTIRAPGAAPPRRGWLRASLRRARRWVRAGGRSRPAWKRRAA